MFEKVEAYYRPGSLREALRLLESGKGRARIVAGGTDVAVDADRSIRVLIDISHAGLSYIRKKGSICSIGAAVTMRELEDSAVIRGMAGGILAEAAASCGSVQIRNMATIGGNLSHGSPAADTATPLLALDAEVVLAHHRGRKKMPLAEFYQELGSGILDEWVVVEVEIPMPARGARWAFQKLGRTRMDIALVSVAAGVQLDTRGRVKAMRLALGAVAPTPVRARGAEELARGRAFDEGLVEDICDDVSREVAPITDLRASAEYRRTMCRVLTRRCLEACAGGKGCSL